MYTRLVFACVWAALAFGQPMEEFNLLGWHEVAGGVAQAGNQFGGIGPRTSVESGKLTSFEILSALRHVGAATYATSQHRGLPFDLGAARLVDGLVVSDGEASLALWSTLLDHGIVTAPVSVDAQARLFVHCPQGMTEACVADAVRNTRTVVSTGPLLAAKRAGNEIEVEAWGMKNPIERIELWSHNRVVASEVVPQGKGQRYTGKLAWTPAGQGDWVAVRVIAGNEWAISGAFLAEGFQAAAPVTTNLKMVFPEIASQQQAGALATVFDYSPSAPGSKRIQEIEMERNELEVDAPVTAVVRIELADGRKIDTRLFEASGVRSLLEDASANSGWSLFEEVLRRCRRISIESRF